MLALVMAGGEGSRLELLTERRARPALPYAGVYRLLDCPLSNCAHSGIEDVWVLQQYRHEGNADAIWRNRELIAQYDPEVTLVLSADHVDRLADGEVLALARHRERGAGVTVVTSEVPEAEASGQAVVEAGARVEQAVLDRGVRVGPDARVGRSDDDGDPALIGELAHVPRGATVAPGGRLGQGGAREPAA